MENTRILGRDFERVGWGLLTILWGVVILIDFMPFEAGLIGTGLIMLGVARATNRLSIKHDGTVIGILMLVWGGLELASPLLCLFFPSADLGWMTFAILLIVLGVIWAAGWFDPTSREETNL